MIAQVRKRKKQIPAKKTLFHHGVQVAMGGGDQSKIRTYFLVTADRPEAVFLKDP